MSAFLSLLLLRVFPVHIQVTNVALVTSRITTSNNLPILTMCGTVWTTVTLLFNETRTIVCDGDVCMIYMGLVSSKRYCNASGKSCSTNGVSFALTVT